MPSTLFVVALPIGNYADITSRAKEYLNSVDWVAAEDTRRARRLFQQLHIRNEIKSLHEHNEVMRIPNLINRLESGESGALISDAGTPLVSDPGYRLVQAAHEAGVRVSPLPGPCAAIAALSVAGMPTDRFTFIGFAPARSSARIRLFEELRDEQGTIVFYEAPHRLEAMLQDAAQTFGSSREGVLLRELTKTHESISKGTLEYLLSLIASGNEPALGECVVIVSGNKSNLLEGDRELQRTLEVLLSEVPLTQAVKIARSLTKLSKKQVYKCALAIKNRDSSNGS